MGGRGVGLELYDVEVVFVVCFCEVQDPRWACGVDHEDGVAGGCEDAGGVSEGEFGFFLDVWGVGVREKRRLR